MQLDDIREFLPKYLSSAAEHDLFDCLKDFDSSQKRMYAAVCCEPAELLQGDIVSGLPMVFLPDTTLKDAPALVLSNSCDNASTNERVDEARVTYCPIFKVFALLEAWTVAAGRNKVDAYLESLRRQRVSTFDPTPVSRTPG